MADTLQVRSSIPGIVLQTVKISVLLFQNWIHLYNFLLLKIFLFNHWVLGLAQEVESSACLAPAPSHSCLFCPLSSVVRGLVTLWRALLLLALRLPGLALTRLLNSPLTFCHLCQAACGHLGFFWGPWKNLLHYWLQSLLLGVLLVLLISWRLCQTAHSFSIKQLKRLALLDNWFSLEFLGLLRQLYWQVENTAALTSWHLAYIVTWATCLVSHMLQAAFEHTAQVAQAQEGEMDMVWEDSTTEPLLPEELKTLDE
ncbi:transmembrane protein 270 [Petaurus breviceps papuanus]|uniref:transmembrane protein 270 n=1 Tax=Petaurus breviceps papuanus TaxID=3040969 RepID=UPI0036DB8708